MDIKNFNILYYLAPDFKVKNHYMVESSFLKRQSIVLIGFSSSIKHDANTMYSVLQLTTKGLMKFTIASIKEEKNIKLQRKKRSQNSICKTFVIATNN